MQQITLTETQNKVMEEWNKTKRGVIQLPTAFGKTVIALEILKNPEYKMICITTNTLHLIEQWKQELQKNDLLKNRVVVVQTIQSLYKLKNQEFDILIWDEGHRSISNKWWDFIKNNKFKYILILTATLKRDDERHLLLKELNINVIADYSYSKGIKEKLVLFLGRLNVTKGPDKLVLAAKEILKERKDIDFVFIGPDELDALGVYLHLSR